MIRQQHVLVSRGGVLASCAAGKGGGSFGARWLPPRTWPSFGSDVLNDLNQFCLIGCSCVSILHMLMLLRSCLANP